MYPNLTPGYLSNIIQSQKNQGHIYNTIVMNPLREINSRTQLYFNSFFPATIRKWNTLTQSMQLYTYFSTFNTYLYSYRIKIPYYFYIGTRIGQIA